MFNNQVSWTPDTTERERNDIIHQDPQFVRKSLMAAIVARKISDTVFLSWLLHSYNKAQMNEVVEILLFLDQTNNHLYNKKYREQVENHWHYPFFCDSLGIDPSNNLYKK